MLGEYGVLLDSNSFFSSLTRLPDEVINFLHTSNGQLAAAVLVAVLLILYFRKR
jgi:hypothetical protein